MVYCEAVPDYIMGQIEEAIYDAPYVLFENPRLYTPANTSPTILPFDIAELICKMLLNKQFLVRNICELYLDDFGATPRETFDDVVTLSSFGLPVRLRKNEFYLFKFSDDVKFDITIQEQIEEEIPYYLHLDNDYEEEYYEDIMNYRYEEDEVDSDEENEAPVVRAPVVEEEESEEQRERRERAYQYCVESENEPIRVDRFIELCIRHSTEYQVFQF
jgi:hypothetical protein